MKLGQLTMGSTLNAKISNFANRNSILIFSIALFYVAIFYSIQYPKMGYWADELMSLYFSDPHLSFDRFVSSRLFSDTNAPSYYFMCYLVRLMGLDGKACFFTINIIGFGAWIFGLYTLWRTSEQRSLVLLAASAALVSGASLSYVVEGRCYFLTMLALQLLASQVCEVMRLERASERDLRRAALFSAAASQIHLFGALFSCAIGGGLILSWWLRRSRLECRSLGIYVIGAAIISTAVWAIPLAAILLRVAHTGFWIPFTFAQVYLSISDFKAGIVGPVIFAPFLVVYLVLSLSSWRSNPLAWVCGVATTAFIVAPIAAAPLIVLISGRYYLVAAPAVLTFACYAALAPRQTESEGQGLRKPLWLRWSALSVVVIAGLVGWSVANTHVRNRPDWRGMDTISQFRPSCAGRAVRVLTTGVFVPEWAFGFVSQDLVKPVVAQTQPVVDVSDLTCPVLGWVEHYTPPGRAYWAETASMREILDQLHETNKLEAPITIVRHVGGFVVIRSPAAAQGR